MLEKFKDTFKAYDYKEVFSKKRIKKLLVQTLILLIDLILFSMIFIHFSNQLFNGNVYIKITISTALFILFSYLIYYIIIIVKYVKYIRKSLEITFDKMTFLLLIITTFYSLIHAIYSDIVGAINHSMWTSLIGNGYMFSFLLRLIVLISFIILFKNNKVSDERKDIIKNRIMIIIGFLIMLLSIYVISPLVEIYTKSSSSLVKENDILNKLTASISIVSFLINLPLSLRGIKKARKYNDQLLTCARAISLSSVLISLFNFLISISLFTKLNNNLVFNYILPVTQAIPLAISLELIISGFKNQKKNNKLIKLTKNLKIDKKLKKIL